MDGQNIFYGCANDELPDTKNDEEEPRRSPSPALVSEAPVTAGEGGKERGESDTIPFQVFARRHKKLLLAFVLLIACVLAYERAQSLFEPSPPAENVVATYNGKSMTTDEMMEHIRLEGIREREHLICEKHGFDHSKCDTLEECETHPIHSLEAYKHIVGMLASRKIIEDWAKVNGIAEREDVRHTLQDIAKELSATSSIAQVHDEELSPASIGKWEVQRYFDENKALYQDKAFSEVEAEIRNILAAKKRETFFPEYIEKLKQDAGVSLNLEILKTDVPGETEINEYYARNINLYTDAKNGEIKKFDEVRAEIKGVLQKQKNDAYYELNGSQTLFTIHDRRYTLRDFMREFNELPRDYQAAFADYESRQKLVEQLLVKELLAEEQGDKTQSEGERHYFNDMRAEYFKQVLHQEGIDEKLSPPTDEEAKEFYTENKSRFVVPAQVKISLIRVHQGLDGEKKEQARKRIDEAMEAIKNGAGFAEVAKQYSDVPMSQIDYWVHEHDLDAALAKKVFVLRQGETSGVLEIQGNFFIVRVNDREEAREQNFEEVKTAVKSYLLQRKHEEAEAILEKDLLDKANLTVYEKTLRKLLRDNTAKNVNAQSF